MYIIQLFKINKHMKIIQMLVISSFLSACNIFSEVCEIKEETRISSLEELQGKYGREHKYYRLVASASLIKLKKSEAYTREVIKNYARGEIQKNGVCDEKEIIFVERYVSLFETGVIDVTFYCSEVLLQSRKN